MIKGSRKKFTFGSGKEALLWKRGRKTEKKSKATFHGSLTSFFTEYFMAVHVCCKSLSISLLSSAQQQRLLYFELTISCLIGRKRAVNFRNQHLWRHLAVDCAIIISRTLKYTDNLAMCDRGEWFLRVIMSRPRAFCCFAVSEEAKTGLFSFNA